VEKNALEKNLDRYTGLSLPSGAYRRSQVASWADEQRRAWLEAASEDGALHDVTRPLEQMEAEAALVPVRMRRAPAPSRGRAAFPEFD
jgi:hypothetical protein